MLSRDNITIKKANASDAAKIYEIEKECFFSPWSKKQLHEEIMCSDSIFLIGICNGEICAYASGKNISGEFYINNIAVSESYRNRGIGKIITLALLESAQNLGCEFATLEVRASNIAARKLYEQAGFVFQGERPGFYSFPDENACIYTEYFNIGAENK